MYWDCLVLVATLATVSTAITTAIATTIASATASVSTAIATATTAESTTITFGARACLVHHQVPTVEALTIGSFNGSTTCIIVGHFHESKAAAPVGGFVHDDLGRGHFSEGGEELVEILVLH
jgi:hypothetical protein